MLKAVLSAVILIIAVILYTVYLFLKKNFNGLSWEEIVFHLKVPMKGTSKGGNTQWRKYTGVGYAGYGSSGGVVTTYRLGARMDDSLTGITHAEGYWNADYVTW